jgi:hypothetical protein
MPAVSAGLFGLFELLAGSVISVIGSERSSSASMRPLTEPSSAMASRMSGVSDANGGRVGNNRPNRPLS